MTTIADSTIASVCKTVQLNCDISDARYARDYSLCIYLLRMREHYRWQQHIPLSKKISVDDLGGWLSDTEEYWDSIEESDFHPLLIAGTEIDPFDIEAVNKALGGKNLVYSAGYGRMGQPHFSLSKMIECHRETDVVHYLCGDEIARDSIPMPAMAQSSSEAQQNTIVVRHDSIRRLLWQITEEWTLHKNEGAAARVLNHYSLLDESDLEKRLTSAADDLAGFFYQHELGELHAARLLGDAYSRMTASLAGTKSEHYARGVRDLLADTLALWPDISRTQSVHHLDFWLAGLNGVRQHLLEQTGILPLLSEGSPSQRFTHIDELTRPEQLRWQRLAKTLLASYDSCGNGSEFEQLAIQAVTDPNKG